MLGVFFSILLLSQPQVEKPNLGIIDLVAEGISSEEKTEILNKVQQEFQWQSAFELLRSEKIDDARKQIDPREAQLVAVRQQHRVNFGNYKSRLQQALQLFSESRFEESLSLLESAWFLLQSSYYAYESEAIYEHLRYRAANLFFLGRREEAKETLKLTEFLYPSSSFDSTRFPPELITFENEVRKEAGSLSNQNILIQPEGVRVRILAYELGLSSGSSFQINLPRSELLANQVLIFEKDSFMPVVHSLAQLPAQVELEEFVRQEAETSNLFGVLGSLSPGAELLSFLSERGIENVVLINATKTLKSEWILKGQLFKAKNKTKTPVVEAYAKTQESAAEILVRRLLLYVDPNGKFLDSHEVKFIERVEEPKAFYEKWWFWTIVGVGAAGVGTGTYFLLKPETQTRFEVRGINQ